MAKQHEIFISHSWKYENDLINLRNLLTTRSYFNVNFREVSQDVAINSENANYIKAVLKQRILASNVFLAIAGVYATYSDWMEWEIKTAKANGIRVIGVVPWGQVRVSSTVSGLADEVVNWNTESIVNAIRRHSK
jgi:hypothetical protein